MFVFAENGIGNVGKQVVTTSIGMDNLIEGLPERFGDKSKWTQVVNGETGLGQCALDWIYETDGEWVYEPYNGGPFHCEDCNSKCSPKI